MTLEELLQQIQDGQNALTQLHELAFVIAQLFPTYSQKNPDMPISTAAIELLTKHAPKKSRRVTRKKK